MQFFAQFFQKMHNSVQSAGKKNIFLRVDKHQNRSFSARVQIWTLVLPPRNVKELLPVIAASKLGCCTFRDGWTINIRYQISVSILKGVCV